MYPYNRLRIRRLHHWHTRATGSVTLLSVWIFNSNYYIKNIVTRFIAFVAWNGHAVRVHNKIDGLWVCRGEQSSPSTRHGRACGEKRYSSYSFTTSTLDGGEWSASRPGRALTPGKGPPVPIVQETGWPPEPVWTQGLEEKSFASAGNRTPIARSSSL
jgi:hypothetical protein